MINPINFCAKNNEYKKKLELQPDKNTKIKVKFNPDGTVKKSVIEKLDDFSETVKRYKNGHLVSSEKKIPYIPESKIESYSYFYHNPDGRISSSTEFDSKKSVRKDKEFFYDRNGKLEAYYLKSSRNGYIKIYDSKGKFADTVNDFSQEIMAMILKLEQSTKRDDRILRSVNLKNRKTGEFEKFDIVKHGANGIRIERSKDKKMMGSATYSAPDPEDNMFELSQVVPVSYADGDYLEIELLSTDNLGEAKSDYRGLGTELVKQVAIESFKQGYEGRIGLMASTLLESSNQPGAFYHKIGLCGPKSGYGYYFLPEFDVVKLLEKT